MMTPAGPRQPRRPRTHRGSATKAFATAALAVVALVVGTALAGPAVAAGGTPLIDWSFTTATAPAGYSFLGRACLTAAGPATARECLTPAGETVGPVPAQGVAPGWLQLTNASTGPSWGGVAGSLLYDVPVPASAGLVVTFDQVQYGGTGADGIAFFLSDGTYDLDDTGAFGGSLGYAQRGTGANPAAGRIEPGVAGGYLGVGLDAYGNYTNDEEARGRGCATPSTATGRTIDAVALRGPGRLGVQPAWTATSTYPRADWVEGYCLLASNPLNGLTLRSTSTLAPDATTTAAMQRHVRVSIAPQPASTTVGPQVVVEIDFGAGYQTVLSATMPEPAPPTYKFGFAASTGGSSDVHLVRNVHVDTTTPLDELTLIKQVPAAGARVAGYVVGESVPYQYVVYNTGNRTLTGLDITDPSLDGPATCPTDHLDPGSSTVCAGGHVVTLQDLQDLVTATAPGQPLVYARPATAHGLAAGAPLTSAPSTAPVRLKAPVGTIRSIATLDDLDNDGLADVGETVHWSYEVTGDPVVDLHDVTVETPSGAVVACGTFVLPAGAVHLCQDPSLVTVVSASDVSVGSVSTTALARGVDVDGTTINTAPSAATVPVAPAPAPPAPAPPAPAPPGVTPPTPPSAPATPSPVTPVSVIVPSAPQATVPAATPELAMTGSDLRIGILGLGALFLGGALVAVSRRRRDA